ncbi:hypothetical protein COHA_003049 [Chlorella ohadii]|uniref:Uncharacterized protein n=1 Tax=Chlorella ohadii TaxID=2649997 RepID=A0AAD5DVN0_9CHLO|nr:hypothetical protein COHA_003049 [Chlorella ohadii]
MELPAVLKQRWVQAALLVVLALWAHKKYRYSRYATGPFPDAWQREAHEHRSYILGLVDFVELYSQGLDVDSLYEREGVYTHCGQTQAALITYFCGQSMDSWGDSQGADVSEVDTLRTLLRSLHGGTPAARAAVLGTLVSLQGEVQRLVGLHRQGAAGGASPAAAGREEQTGDAEGENAQQAANEEAGSGQLRWDGRQLPQLVFRCHMHGDEVVRCWLEFCLKAFCLDGVASGLEWRGHPDAARMVGPELPAATRAPATTAVADVQAYHTFVIVSRPALQFDMYQSFIGHYTLHQYPWDHRKPLSYEQMMQFLADVEELQSAKQWTQATDKKYQRLFGVSLARTHGYRGVHLVQFSGGMGWQMGQGAALTLRCGLVCGVPPPNSTAMAASRQEGGGACGSAGACHSPFDFS